MPVEDNSQSTNPTPSSNSNKSSKLPVIVGVIIGILILAGVGYYFFGQGDGGSDSSSSSNSAAETAKKTIKDLLSGGDAVTCTFDSDEGSGTVYVSDKKLYAEYTVTTDGVTTKGYIMQNDEYTYIWSAAENQGIKMKLTEEDKADTPTNVADLENEGAANCKAWSVDNSKFEEPSGVTFTDLNTPTTTPTN